MKRFINSKSDIVTEALDGFLATTPNDKLARLDGYPHTKVIVRTDWNKSRVALVSGGGSGHEPAHAGFVGEGMLTAAVCGEVFASPSVDAVLSAIVAVSGEAGCLLIVKNYTGDRLNFGLAAERAKALGYKVEVVIVADDISIPGAHQPRGLAGTLFVHKVAGYLAARGALLEDVAQAARDAAACSYSIGLSLETCTVPGNAKDDYLKDNEAELGLGIHGEPGVTKIVFDTAAKLMRMVCDQLEKVVRSDKARYAAIINNLGAVPPLEMGILAHSLSKTALGGHIDIVIGPAHLMTSLDMNGFSVSIMELDAPRKKALLSDVEVSNWPGLREGGTVTISALPDIGSRKKYSFVANETVQAVVLAVCNRLVSAEGELNELDARTGDGDTGTTFGNAARYILSELEEMPFGDGADMCATLSDRLSQNMGGSSGVLMAILFAAASEAFHQKASWPSAIMAGVTRMMNYGGAKLGDRTMLDSLLPALEALLNGKSVSDAANAAREGADATAMMDQARAGRSAYVPSENLRGVTDPGAEAIALVFEEISTIV